MTPQRWARAKSLFERALERPVAERLAFVSGECRDDEALAATVLRLLEAHEAPAALDAHVLDHAPGLDPGGRRGWIGRSVGPYRIVERLGEGGMGEVYRAVRDDGEFDRVVAIKRVRGGVDSEPLLRRLRAERRILATLEHPGIARLIDGGDAGDGMPYLVMELVEGEPLDAYCERRRLGLAERIALFREVCAAVQYAHQRLVVHRDLKPANILVTGEGRVKLLDFGIAKLLEPTTGAASEPTVAAESVLTPDYASPEQLRGEPVTTASDIYALGVVLFRLLAGRSPYGTTASPHELMRAICEVEAPRPSAVAPGARIPEDLDTIVAMALRKEPQRRYASAAELSDDLRRHLAGLPVRAHDDTLAYRARKWIGRHKFATAAATVTAVALVTSSIVTAMQASAARAERVRAERHFADVRRLVSSLLFDVHDAVQDLPGSIAARRLLVQNALSYLDVLGKEAGDDVALKRELGIAYRKLADIQGRAGRPNIGDEAGARASYAKAIALFEELLAARAADNETRVELARALTERAWVQLLERNDKAARPDAERALALAEEVFAAEPGNVAAKVARAEANIALAWILQHEKNTAEALRHTGIALAIYEEVARGKEYDRILRYQHGGAYLSAAQFTASDGKPESLAAAYDTMRKGFAIHSTLVESNPNDLVGLTAVATAQTGLARLAVRRNDDPAAIDWWRRSIESYDRLARLDPEGSGMRPGRVTNLFGLGDALLRTGDVGGAAKAMNAAHELAASWQGRTTSQRMRPLLGRSEYRMGRVAAAQRDWRGAERWYSRAVAALGVADLQPILTADERGELEGARKGLEDAKARK